MTQNEDSPTESPGQDAIRVLGVAGSLRTGSFNRALLRAAQELAPDDMNVTTFELDDIPLYNYDVEAQGDPEPVASFKEAIAGADAVLIATPEYQHSVPGVLKNALDWASRPPSESVLQRNPAAIMGATPGRLGTARERIRDLLVHLAAWTRFVRGWSPPAT